MQDYSFELMILIGQSLLLPLALSVCHKLAGKLFAIQKKNTEPEFLVKIHRKYKWTERFSTVLKKTLPPSLKYKY